MTVPYFPYFPYFPGAGGLPQSAPRGDARAGGLGPRGDAVGGGAHQPLTAPAARPRATVCKPGCPPLAVNGSSKFQVPRFKLTANGKALNAEDARRAG